MQDERSSEELRRAFAHVLWIGGASDAGKSTIARLLAERNYWQIYPCDFHEHNHFFARADPQHQPLMYDWIRRTPDAQWIQPTVEELFHHILASNDERFPMICDDLRAMPRQPMILVEGPRLFPRLVAPLLTDRHQAIWLMASEAFVQESFAKRDKPQGRHRSSDPERYRQNFLGREALLRQYIRHEVTVRNLPLAEVDGSRSIAEMAEVVAAHFAPYIAAYRAT